MYISINILFLSAKELGDKLNPKSAEFEAVETSLFIITALLVLREENSQTTKTTYTDKSTEPCTEMCSCTAPSCNKLQRSQAFVMQGVMLRHLVQQLCRAPLKIFAPVMIELAISCWYWLLAARPALKLQVIFSTFLI